MSPVGLALVRFPLPNVLLEVLIDEEAIGVQDNVAVTAVSALHSLSNSSINYPCCQSEFQG